MTARHHELAVLDAIRKSQRNGRVSHSTVRTQIPEWVPGKVIGRVYRQLLINGVLEHVHYETGDDWRLAPIYQIKKPILNLQPPPTSPSSQSTQGPCASCQQPCQRYGDHGHPLCLTCQESAS